MGGGGRIGSREWHTLVWFLRSTVTDGFLLCGLCGVGAECTKHRTPVLLAEVVDDIIHESYGRRAPVISIEVANSNEVSSFVHLVCTFDLPRKYQGGSAWEGGVQNTAAAARARMPNGRFPTPGSSSGMGSIMPDEE
jgi:hypothetical protein